MATVASGAGGLSYAVVEQSSFTIKAGADAVACQLVVKLYKTPKLTNEEAARLEREYDQEMQPIQDEMDEIYEKLTTDFEKAKANFFAVLEEPVLKEH